MANAAVSGANMIALGILVGVFAKIYSKTKAQLPLGMILFSGLLFLHNAIGVYAYLTMMELYAAALLPYLLAVGVAELAGIIILLRVSIQ